MDTAIDFDSSEWEDVEPIPQDDGPVPVAPIAYSPDCASPIPWQMWFGCSVCMHACMRVSSCLLTAPCACRSARNGLLPSHAGCG